MEVPLAMPNPEPGTDDTMLLPGASTLRKLALLENSEIPLVFVVDPTLITFDRQAGAESAPALPLLPAATTVAMFASRRLCTMLR